MWTVGGTLSARSGGPITAFGVRWPDDNRSAGGPSEFSGGGSGWLCEAGCDDWTTRHLVYTEKGAFGRMPWVTNLRSEEHTSELQSLMRISYAVFCLKKKQQHHTRVT